MNKKIGVTRVYLGEKLLHEFPDCQINLDEYWCYVTPVGTTYDDRKKESIFVTPREISNNISIIQVLQEEA